MAANGTQLIENIYLNSSEFDVKLSPDIGPNMKYILDHVYECMLPSPAQAKLLTGGNAPSDPQFMQENVYPYTAKELYEQLLTHTNFGYFYFILACVDSSLSLPEADHVYLMASLEVARAHPLYVLEYALRNSWQLLYDPGWLHAQGTLEPHLRGGLFFPFSGATTAGRGNIGDRLEQPALSEAEFIPLERQPRFIKGIYFDIESVWHEYYQPVTRVVFWLICVTWLSTVVGFLEMTMRAARWKWWSEVLLSAQVVPASLTVSVILLGNVFVTGLLVNSYYRYDFSITMLKIMLAGLGCTIIVELVRRIGASFKTGVQMRWRQA